MAQADDWHFSDAGRVVAVGDVHGAYADLLETLQAADVIDKTFSWSGGDSHLVFTGDMLDRGPDSRLVMDLVMRLEQEAVLDGGRVHLVLGNHEVMNLVGDVRYVSDPEFAAFSGDESAKEREHWYRWYRHGKPGDADEQALRAEFDQKAPPGFFGYRRAFRDNGFYGKWLLEKPLMVVVNGTVFVHGGIPPFVEEHGLEGVNGRLKSDLVNYVRAHAQLLDAGVISPMDLFREIPPILEKKMEDGQLDESLEKQAKAVTELTGSPLHGPTGPTWYRGTAICNPLMEADQLHRALNRIDAKRVAFGHTTTVSRRVQQRMNGQIIELDTGMLKSSYRGSGHALVIEGEKISVVNQDGTKERLPIPHPARVGGETDVFDDEVLAGILANGTITETSMDGTTWGLLRVKEGDRSILAQFRALPADDGFAPEIAAYLLDRMLGLFMVPTTVLREHKGRQGSLQFVPVPVLSERERVADNKGGRMYCSRQKQVGAMYVFDALIHNPVRSPLSMLYGPDDWLLILVDHRQSFGEEIGLPEYLQTVELTIGEQWRAALQEIDDEMLGDSLGDVLDPKRLAALAKRRDALIEKAN